MSVAPVDDIRNLMLYFWSDKGTHAIRDGGEAGNTRVFLYTKLLSRLCTPHAHTHTRPLFVISNPPPPTSPRRQITSHNYRFDFGSRVWGHVPKGKNIKTGRFTPRRCR